MYANALLCRDTAVRAAVNHQDGIAKSSGRFLRHHRTHVYAVQNAGYDFHARNERWHCPLGKDRGTGCLLGDQVLHVSERAVCYHGPDAGSSAAASRAVAPPKDQPNTPMPPGESPLCTRKS